MMTEKNLKKEEQIYYDAFDVARILGLWVKLQAVSPLKAFVYKG